MANRRITKVQHEVLLALLTDVGWTDHGIDRKRRRGHRAYFLAFVGKRMVRKRTIEALASATFVRRLPGRFEITEQGRAYLISLDQGTKP